jgi:pimeloyl-ACP methyl ester carboxylesterase
LATVAPMGDPIGFSYGFAEMLGFGERIRTGFLRVLEKRVSRLMSDFDVPALLAGVDAGRASSGRPLPPLLIVHDLKDREVPVRAGQSLARQWAGAEFQTTSGLGHNRILVDAETVGRVAAFVTRAPAMATAYTGGDSVSSDLRTPPAP